MFRKTSLAAAIRRTLVLSALTTAASQMAVAQDQTDQADELVGEIVVTGSRGFVRIERSLLVNLRRVAFAERALPGGFVFHGRRSPAVLEPQVSQDDRQGDALRRLELELGRGVTNARAIRQARTCEAFRCR